jgi:hypothetical protein
VRHFPGQRLFYPSLRCPRRGRGAEVPPNVGPFLRPEHRHHWEHRTPAAEGQLRSHLTMSISREVSEYIRRALMSTRRACRRISALSNLGFLVVLILCGLTIASFALGLALQPSATAPAEVPNPPKLDMSFQSGNPLRLFVYSFLEQTNTRQTELVMSATGDFASHQTITRWTIGVLGFSGYLCPKQASGISLMPLKGFQHDYEITGKSKIPTTSGQPFLVISLCWDNDAPLITNGSYVSAALPQIVAAGDQSGTVTRSLVLNGTSLSSYSLAGGIAPTEVTARSWIWTDNLSTSFQSQARAEIPIIASSLPGIQRDNQDIFYSGILFGIAGGAAVSIVPALLGAFDRGKTEDQHRAGAGVPHPSDKSQPSAAEQTGHDN